MTIFHATFSSLSILFGIAIVGFFVIRRNILDAVALRALFPLVLDIALPCMIFGSILVNFHPESAPGWWHLPLWWIAQKIFTLVFATLLTLPLVTTVRREFIVSLLFQNEIGFPLAIIGGIYGSGSPHVVNLFLFTILYAPVFYGFGHLFLSSGTTKEPIPWSKVINAVLVTTVVAMTIQIAGVGARVPGVLLSMTKWLGDMTIPLFMLIIGGTIALDVERREKLRYSLAVYFTVAKTLLLPLVTLAILMLLRPAHDTALMIFIQSCVPPLVAVPMIVERAGGDRAAANQMLVASSVASLVTIPVMIALFERVFVG